MNDGDSGRITYVGKSLSGLDLDMIYTVASSDKDSWQANEGAEGIPQGLTFTGTITMHQHPNGPMTAISLHKVFVMTCLAQRYKLT
ncbi:hypothetical protein LB438_02345 [Lactococcus lactis subsp. lactis]|nr:hypothetical protein [Lactococcus lactis]